MKQLGKKLILAPLALVILAGVALVVLPMVGINLPISVKVQKGESASAQSLDSTQATEKVEEKKPETERKYTMVYSTGERVLNLADPGALRYLKVEIVLEFASDVNPEKVVGEAYKKAEEEFAGELAQRRPAMEDAITSIITSKAVADVDTPEDKDALKSELKTRLATLVPDEEIKSIYFTQFIFQ